MAVQVTIIGLGQVGTSVGLALQKIKDQVMRVGNDRDPSISRQAEKLGAVDKVVYNLPASVEKADLIILAIPIDEVQETIQVIAQDLKPGSLLVDLSPVKGPVLQWAKELLPTPDRYFAALTPSQNPAYLLESGEGPENAHADLFQNSLMLIATLPGIDDSALDLATTLTQLLGATPLFIDPSEADGLIANSQVLPRLAAAALVNTTINQPGWREARKLAGRAYALATEPVLHFEESRQLGQSALLNSENTVRMINMLIEELLDMRDAIARQDADALKQRLTQARDGREQWLRERNKAEWEKQDGTSEPLPSNSELLGRLFTGKFLGGQRRDKNRPE
jgi:prephenate dehydrogenase